MTAPAPLVGIALAVLAAGAAHAQAYPAKPIRFLVGPGPDALARLVGQRFTEAWGQQVVIDQRPGAGGTIAADTVARAQPDGYTLLLASGSYTINASLQQQPFDLIRDFAPVSLVASVPFILVVNNAVPAASVRELVELARSRPGQLNYASAGNGTPPHLAGEMLKMMAGVNMTHVPYKGAAPAMVDVIAGQVQVLFAVGPVGIPQVQAGKVRGLAVSTAQRVRGLPDLPTVAEAGLPGFEVMGWNGVLAPARTQAAVVNRLYGEIAAALKSPETVSRLAGLGFEPVGSSPDEFARFLRADIARWAGVIRSAGVRVD